MNQYLVSEEAEHELDLIFVYWAERASPDTADRLVDAIMDRFWLLSQHPEAGVSTKIAPSVRCFPAGKYLIYYRFTSVELGGGVEIVHVFHGQRDQRKARKRRVER